MYKYNLELKLRLENEIAKEKILVAKERIKEINSIK